MAVSYTEKIAGRFYDLGGFASNVQHPSLGARGDGEHDDGPVFGGLTAGHYLVPAGAYRIGGDTTVGAGVVLHLAQGAVLRPGPDATLTLAGPIEAGPYRVFDPGAGGVFSLAASGTEAVRPEWFGEITEADSFQAAVDAAPSGATIALGPRTYTVSGIRIDKTVNIRGVSNRHSRLRVPSAEDTVGIFVSRDDVNISDVALESTGDKDDGTGVVGLVFDDGSGSIGYNAIERVFTRDFSGAAIRYVNCIDCRLARVRGIGNRVGIHLVGGYGLKGTTYTIRDSYLTGDIGIDIDDTARGLVERTVCEVVRIGIRFRRSSFNVLNNVYFEAVDEADIHATDARYINIGQASGSAGRVTRWSGQAVSRRTIASLQNGGVTVKRFRHYFEYDTDSRTIDPYRYIADGNSHMVDGMVYDGHRVLQMMTGHNLLAIDGWTEPYDPRRKAVRWRGRSGPQLDQQVRLAAGPHLLLSTINSVRGGLAGSESVQVLDAGGDELASFDLDPSGRFVKDAERLVYFPFEVPSDGEYTVRFRADAAAGESLEVELQPILFRTDAELNDVADWRRAAYDQAMRNSFALALHMSGVADGHNALGDGKRWEYGTAPPSSGSHQQGDRVVNTEPEELGPAGERHVIDHWRCVEAGSPGRWVEMRMPTGN